MPQLRTTEVLVALGEHLRAARAALGISQVELARRVGMEPTNLAKVERGAKNLTVDTLVRIANGLGVELQVAFVRPRRPKVARSQRRA